MINKVGNFFKNRQKKYHSVHELTQQLKHEFNHCISKWNCYVLLVKYQLHRSSVDKPQSTWHCICFWYKSQGPEVTDSDHKIWVKFILLNFIVKCVCLETGRWLLISQQEALTSEETQTHLWCRCRSFQIPIQPILTWDLLTTTYPNNRAVCGYLCNSRWDQRRSQASGCTSWPLWMTTHLRCHIHLTPNMVTCSQSVTDSLELSSNTSGQILALR